MRPIRIGLAFDVDRVSGPSAAGRADVLIFPELLDGGYAALESGRGEHDLDDEFVGKFRRLTHDGPITCIAGSMQLKDPSGVRHNASLVFRGGKVIHRYDKIHLFRPAGDHRFFSPGNRFRPFTLRVGGAGVSVGLILCYDIRFPELARVLAMQGIQILFVPARWPRVRDAAWRTLLRARAIENQIFVVGCNARGREGGHSYIFGPTGQELFTSRRKKQLDLDVAVIDPGEVDAARTHHSNLAEARLLRFLRFPASTTGRRAEGARLRRSAGG